MPVARLTNVADYDALLGEIRSFLFATGDWTIHRDLLGPSEGAAAGGRELILSNGDVLAGLRSTTTGAGTSRLYLFDGTGSYMSGAPSQLPGNSGVVVSDASFTSASTPNAKVFAQQGGPFPTVHLFTDSPSTYCHVVAEIAAGRYRHMQFGNMLRFGTWTGGAYYGVTFWNSSTTYIDVPAAALHSVPFDGAVQSSNSTQGTFHAALGDGVVWRAPQEAVVNGVTRRQARGSARGGFGTAFRSIQESPWSGLIALVPVTIWAESSSDTPATTRCIGQIPDTASINMRNIAAGDSIFIGADEWVCFPLAQKRDPAERLDAENSGYFGTAYLVR